MIAGGNHTIIHGFGARERDSQRPFGRILLVLLRLAKSRPSVGCSLAWHLRVPILAEQEKYVRPLLTDITDYY